MLMNMASKLLDCKQWASFPTHALFCLLLLHFIPVSQGEKKRQKYVQA
jgi:hypothetical protein